jgi:hypothetical protein
MSPPTRLRVVSQGLKFAKDHGYFDAMMAAGALGTFAITAVALESDRSDAQQWREHVRQQSLPKPAVTPKGESQSFLLFIFFY